MKVEYLSPDQLIPYQKNAKQHTPAQVQRIANSIKMFGWTQPIVVDENNVVVIGHGRLMAAMELHLDKVPVVRRDDLTEKQINACRLADNKTNESEWISGLLDEELADLDIAGIDMEQFGFDVGGGRGIIKPLYRKGEYTAIRTERRRNRIVRTCRYIKNGQPDQGYRMQRIV